MEASSQSNEVVFRRSDSVGAAAAEDDSAFLSDCFVDTGDVARLLDCDDPKRIIVGRTGAGKSALLYELERSQPNVVRLDPHSLSLNFIATNQVIAFFEEAGVNLTPFYVLLWKHLLVVELLKKRFRITNEESHRACLSRIREIVYGRKDKFKAQALEYLEQWGNKFWLTTEERVHELTQKVETTLKGGAEAKVGPVQLSASGARNLTTEQRQQIVDHGRDAVSRVQIRELDNMLQILEESVFDDRKDRYYVIIDMLDEDWADSRIRYKLIRALIDCVRRFKQLASVKIIIAMRQDLLDKVVHLEAVPGFQEEKYNSLYLTIHWDRKELVDLVDRRICQLFRRRYTKSSVSFSDVFASQIDGTPAIDYLLARTFDRPRDIIMFVNECISHAEGRAQITASIVKTAEEEYSRGRLRSLAHEWSVIFPNFLQSCQIFAAMRDSFEVSQLSEKFLGERYAEICDDVRDPAIDPITQALDGICSKNGNLTTQRNYVLREFFRTGLIGIKSGPTDSVTWAKVPGRLSLDSGSIRPSSIVVIHPMFHRALGTRLRTTR